LIISDACNSGNTFYDLTRDAPKNPSCNDTKLLNLKSFQVLTSSANEQVSRDQSQFVEVFVKSLDQNNSSCISVNEIYYEMKDKFRNQSLQTPQFGSMKNYNHQNGTFFFIKRDNVD
jgi:hypothetical protein